MSKTYTCICGKIFDNPQKFNGHKSNCKVHKQNKGNYEQRQEQLRQQNVRTGQKLKQSFKNKQED